MSLTNRDDMLLLAENLPKGLQVTDLGTSLLIERRWFGLGVLPIAFFAVIWNGMMGFFIVNMLRSPSFPAVGFLFMTGHLAVGVAVAYAALAGFLNHTRIEVDTQRLSVQHGPLPWIGNRPHLDPATIDQLYVEQKLHRTKNGSFFTYTVHALCIDGSKIKLVSRLPKSEQARYIARRLEEFLGLQDQAVPGEYRG